MLKPVIVVLAKCKLYKSHPFNLTQLCELRWSNQLRLVRLIEGKTVSLKKVLRIVHESQRNRHLKVF